MIVSNEGLDLWRVYLTTGRRLIVSFPHEHWDVPISKVKPLLIKELNERFGCELVRKVKYYGRVSEIQISNCQFNKSVLKKYGL